MPHGGKLGRCRQRVCWRPLPGATGGIAPFRRRARLAGTTLAHHSSAPHDTGRCTYPPEVELEAEGLPAATLSCVGREPRSHRGPSCGMRACRVQREECEAEKSIQDSASIEGGAHEMRRVHVHIQVHACMPEAIPARAPPPSYQLFARTCTPTSQPLPNVRGM